MAGCKLEMSKKRFQPTPPAQGATEKAAPRGGWEGISTHAPRTGGDIRVEPLINPLDYFNPRPPHRGRRDFPVAGHIVSHDFNPRPPHRGRQISQTATRAATIFQPTPPAQGATSLEVILMYL